MATHRGNALFDAYILVFKHFMNFFIVELIDIEIIGLLISIHKDSSSQRSFGYLLGKS